MATFAEDQVRSLAEIFGQTSDYMSQYLSIRAGIITDSDKTSILLRVTAYQAIETDNVEVEANLKNFGAHVSADRKRSLVKQKIAALIGWEVSTGASLVRG
jgi:hypothetical protein